MYHCQNVTLFLEIVLELEVVQKEAKVCHNHGVVLSQAELMQDPTPSQCSFKNIR